MPYFKIPTTEKYGMRCATTSLKSTGFSKGTEIIKLHNLFRGFLLNANKEVPPVLHYTFCLHVYSMKMLKIDSSKLSLLALLILHPI